MFQLEFCCQSIILLSVNSIVYQQFLFKLLLVVPWKMFNRFVLEICNACILDGCPYFDRKKWITKTERWERARSIYARPVEPWTTFRTLHSWFVTHKYTFWIELSYELNEYNCEGTSQYNIADTGNNLTIEIKLMKSDCISIFQA